MKDICQNIREELESILKGFIDENAMKKIKFLQSIHSLLKLGQSTNKRTLFYDSVPIFKTQNSINKLVRRYSRIFGCEQKDLNIKSSLKGIFHGRLIFIMKNNKRIEYEGKNLIPDMDDVIEIKHSYKIALVIEKDTVFSKVESQRYLTVCGKGYPCQNTVKFLKMMENTVKMYCLTDFDPYGLHIFITYKKTIPGMARIGLKIEDVLKYKVKKHDCIHLNDFDKRMIERLKKYSELCCEAEFIEGLEMKMELEILFNRLDFDIFEYLEMHGVIT